MKTSADRAAARSKSRPRASIRGVLHIPAKRINPGSRRQSSDGSDPDFQPIPEHFLDNDRPGADARRRSRSALQCLQDHRRKAHPLDVAGYRAKDVRTARPDVALYLNRRLWPFTALNLWTGSPSTRFNSGTELYLNRRQPWILILSSEVVQQSTI
jgi:hypothetical protein